MKLEASVQIRSGVWCPGPAPGKVATVDAPQPIQTLTWREMTYLRCTGCGVFTEVCVRVHTELKQGVS